MTINEKLIDWEEYFDAVPSSEYFDAVPSSTLVNKGCMKNFFKKIDSSISSNEAMVQFEIHTETVF